MPSARCSPCCKDFSGQSRSSLSRKARSWRRTFVILQRLQFAGTAGFHIIFPCLIIGFAFYLSALEVMWLKTRRPVYRAQFDFWVKPFAAAFILGVTTGVVLSFQLDTAFGGFTTKHSTSSFR